MPRAYVLISVGSGAEDRVLEEIRGMAEVQAAFVSYGVFDLIVKIKTDSMERLKELIARANFKSTFAKIERLITDENGTTCALSITLRCSFPKPNVYNIRTSLLKEVLVFYVN
jgi:DNA-binding Lrp family transcriptional regulator